MDLPALRRILAELRITEARRLEACTEYDVYHLRDIAREVDHALRNAEQALAKATNPTNQQGSSPTRDAAC